MKVDLIFIRHGLSCTNVIKSYNSFVHQVKRLSYTDPQVTHFGELDINKLAKTKILPKPDIILSSCLLRAMETAAFTFPSNEKQIFVTPFIKEMGPTAGNQPGTVESQRKRFNNRIDGKNSSDRLNYSFAIDRDSKFIKECFESNLSSFLKWLEVSLPYLLVANNLSMNRKKIVIAIVTHSNFMKKFLRSKATDKPYHLGAYKLSFMYNKSDLFFSECSRVNLLIPTYRPDKNIRTFGPGIIPPYLRKPVGSLIFQGFPEPTKKDFLHFQGSKNCKHLI